MSSDYAGDVGPIRSRSSTAPPRKRNSKACETCRQRRIKCLGPPPCEPCRIAGVGTSCTVRLKARPTRAPSAKLLLTTQHQPTAGGPSVETSQGSATSTSPAAALAHRRNPLDEIEAALAGWCVDKGVPFSRLVFHTDRRLAQSPPAPLPPPAEIVEYEDALMDQLYAAPEMEGRSNDHRTLLRSLYGRYRTVPDSLTEDQRGLVYALLCVSRYHQVLVRNGPMDLTSYGSPSSPGQTMDIFREVITYYHMACNALATWNRSSLVAAWTLFYLIPVTLGLGDPGDTRDILEQMAWQIRKLGIHKRASADVYQPQEQVGALFAAFFYIETLRSSLMDLRPMLPVTEVDFDPTNPTHNVSDCLIRVSYYTTKVLADFADPAVDTTSLAYITATEAEWTPSLRELRHSVFNDTPRAQICWAEFRYNWLRILLYVPHLVDPQLGPQAYSTLARAVSQIIYTYLDLSATNQLHPHWPQVQRITVVGQLLILCHEAGELHRREAQLLFQHLVDILGMLQCAWPICVDLINGFSAAAATFGINVAVGDELSVPQFGERAPLENDEPFNWFPFDLGLDFDVLQLPLQPPGMEAMP